MLTDAKIHKALGFNEFTSEPTKVMLTHIANAAIAAYQAELRQGVELPEPDIYADNGVEGYSADPLQQYGDQRDQAGYLRGLEDAKRVMESQHTWITNIAAAQLIEKLKGGE